MEWKTVLWRIFVTTGDIEMYLMYKSSEDDKKEEEIKCQTLVPRVS